MNKRGGEVRWAVFRHLEKERTISLEHSSTEGPLSAMVAKLPADDYRWALVNVQFETTGGGKRSKMTLVTWVPDSIARGSARETVKAKSLGVMYTKLLKKEMDGVVCFIQANDYDDISEQEVLERVSKFERDPVNMKIGLRI